MLKPLNDENFHDEVRESQDPIVILFSGSWCQPCQRFKPVLEQMAERMAGDIKFMIADLDENERTAQDLNIRSVPSLVMFEGGMVRDVTTGTMNISQLREWITENI